MITLLKRALAAAVLLAVSFTVPLAAQAAQAATPFKNSVTFQPIGLAYGTANLEYERVLSPTTAGAVRVDFFSRGLGDFTATALGFGGSYRWFTSLANEKAPRGLWYGPAVDYLQVNAKFAGDNATSSFFQVAAELGYKWIFGDNPGIIVSPFAQLGYNFGSLSVAGNNLDYGNRLIANVGVSVGLAF